MALQGWRLFGVTGTIFAYIAVILFLSVINMQSPHPKRQTYGRFGEVNPIRDREVNGLKQRHAILWCKQLKFTDGSPFFHSVRPNSSHHINGINLESKYRTDIKKTIKKSVKNLNTNNNNNNINNNNNNNINNNIKNSQIANYSSNSNNIPIEGLTALASFPGSGNTWLRYLLQQSTGIFTGSIYKDFGLLKSGFPAENISNKSVLVVKTHEWGPRAWQPFEKGILLVRDPEKSILAEFNRQSGGHVGFASPDRYRRTRGRYWQQFVGNKLMGWENMNLAWAKNFTGSLKIVFYDDLVGDVEGVLREILSFLNFPIDEKLLSCAIARKEGIYRRKKRILAFDPYSPAMRKVVEAKKIKVFALLGRHI